MNFDELRLLANLSDTVPENLDGYLCMRPELMPEAIRTWAPCGCCLTQLREDTSVLTGCGKTDCNFSWAEAKRAMEAFIDVTRDVEAEAPREDESSTSLLGDVEVDLLERPQPGPVDNGDGPGDVPH